MKDIADEVCERLRRWLPRDLIMGATHAQPESFQRGLRFGHDGPDARAEIMHRIRHERPDINTSQIGRFFGLDRSTVGHWLNKAYCPIGGSGPRIRELADQAKQQRELQRKAEQDAADRMIVQRLREAEEDMRRMLTEPPDPRSLTGRLLGDPMPGRSALDKRRTMQ